MKEACWPSAMFKKCSFCQFEWPSRSDFLNDPNIKIIGYQASFDELMSGVFLFNHSCRTTLAIHVDDFRDLYKGVLYHERKTGGPDCKGFCLNESELGPCHAHCECAFVREIIQIIKEWKNNPA